VRRRHRLDSEIIWRQEESRMQPIATAPSASSKPPSGRRFVLLLAAAALLVGLLALWLGRSASNLVRPRLAEVTVAASACKAAVSDAFANAVAGAPPALRDVRCDLGTSGRYARIRVDSDGAIHLTAQGFDRAEVDERMLLLVPYQDDATPKSAALASHRTPVQKWVCRAPPENGIPERFLPRDCRQATG
jgi:type IV pilus assembly protein PilA